MDENPKDFKPFGKKNTIRKYPLDQYTRHFNYSVFPNLKVYSLSTQPPDNPINSAAATAAADNNLTFADPPAIVKALPSEDDYELHKQKHQEKKEQHLNLQKQLEEHKKNHPVRSTSEKSQDNSPQKGPFQPSKITETLFPPHTTQQESSKSLLFGAFTDRFMSHDNDSALVLASDPIGEPGELRNQIRSVVLKVRAPLADYQSKNGVPIQQQISFVDLIRMLFVCSQTAVFTILTMLWNLYPLLDGFLFVIRFVLDKILHVCQAETSAERSYRVCVFMGQIVILLLANLFIMNVIVMPVTFLILYTMGNCMKLMGVYG